MKKILIFYTSVGLGHKSIAENIGWHLERAGFNVKLFDVYQLQSGRLVSWGTKVHQFINTKTPFLWKWMYTSKLFTNLTLGSRVKVAGRNYHKVKQEIEQFQPDLVITTQTSASAILEFLKQKGWYKNQFAIVFSDYHLHRYWLYPSADFYLINIEEQKNEMVDLGIPADKIYILGTTLKPRPEVNIEEVRQRLGIKENEKLVLVASGSLGTGMKAQWFRNIVEKLNHKVIIVTGKNEQLRQELQDLPNVYGFYQPMAELYAIADVFLTKPGGLTTAETFQWNLPLLITHWLPGQEEINYWWLMKHQLVMPLEKDFIKTLENELATGNFRKQLESNKTGDQITQRGREGVELVKVVSYRLTDHI